MADHGSGAIEGASLLWSPVPDEGEPQGLLPQLTDELTSLRQHVERIQEDVAGLVARLHTLDSAISGVEVRLGDRLTEYADTVVQLGRGFTTNLSTYREGNDRTIAELRRALADSEELLRTVLTKTDDVAVELATVHTELSTEGSDDGLDVDELRGIVREVVEPLDVRAAVGQLAADVAMLNDRVANELATTRRTSPPAGVDAALQAQLLTAFETLRQEVAGLKRRIALRAKPTAIDDADVERIADAIAKRITEAFEVVPDDEPPRAPKPAAKKATLATKSSSGRR